MAPPLDVAARERLYAFFSRLFVREVDDAFAAVLAGAQGRALLPAFAASAEFDALGAPERRAALFDADFAHVTMVNVVPYESFYRREDGMVESGGANPLARFLLQYGFEADLGVARSLSPDHLGIELELMSVLCAREREADTPEYAARVREVQRELLEQHLLTWAPVYLLTVQRSARTALYRDGADAALHLLHADYQQRVEEAGR